MDDSNDKVDAGVVEPGGDELKNRIAAFTKEYGELVDKHKIDYATYPVFVPDGQGGFRTVVNNTPVDISKRKQPEGFVK